MRTKTKMMGLCLTLAVLGLNVHLPTSGATDGVVPTPGTIPNGKPIGVDCPSGIQAPICGEWATDCDSAGTVCATAIAEAAVSCTKVFLGAQCTGGAILGGYGASPIGLPGEVYWEGTSQCFNCPDSTPQTRSGYGSWSGGAERGAGSVSQVTHGTSYSLFGCPSKEDKPYTVQATSIAKAYLKISVPDILGIGRAYSVSSSIAKGVCP